MSAAPLGRMTQVIDLALVDAPELDARLDRDPEKLEELARDILRRGLIEPIKVFVNGDRYELVDGYRRFLATKSAGLKLIECFVYPSQSLALEGIKYAANAFREDMSPAEEAVMFYKLLREQCGDDIEQLCALVNKKLSYVDNRLALVNGDELVFEAVKERKISLGVAAELNKLPDDGWRRYYLTHAIQGGSTVATVAGWVIEWNNLYGSRVEQPAAPAVESGPAIVNTYEPHRCAICGKVDPRFIPEQLAVHTHCKLAVLDPMLAAYRGES